VAKGCAKGGACVLWLWEVPPKSKACLLQKGGELEDDEQDGQKRARHEHVCVLLARERRRFELPTLPICNVARYRAHCVDLPPDDRNVQRPFRGLREEHVARPLATRGSDSISIRMLACLFL
jgi:hypothetical protein